MAGNNDQVKYTDLFDSDITSGLNALKTALEEVVKQIAALKAEAQALKKALGNANTATREQQQTTAADAAEAERLSRQIKELTTEEARLKAAIAEANRMTKLQGQAANAAEGSLNQMRARYKLLVAEMSNYNLKTEEGRRKMQATAAQARKLRDEIYKLEASYGQFGRNVGNYTGALSRFGARLKEVAARFVAFNAAFLSATGLIRFGKALFEVRKELESTLVTYKALAGEIQGAKLFEEVKNFALTTPVTLNAASKAVQTMLSFGVAQDKVVDIMKRLGDISSADSERMQRLALAYSQATQAGRLMGQDTLQFINAGFNPLYYISLRTGESMEYLRDQMKKGKIDIQQVTQAIIDATSEGGQFNGMLEKQRETMKGAAAIMEGAWQNMLNEMGSDMESGIVGIIKWLTKLMQNWRETIRTMRELAVSFGTAKVAMWAYDLVIQKTTADTVANTAATNAATTATKGFTAALGRIGIFAAIMGVTYLVQKLVDVATAASRAAKEVRDFENAAANGVSGTVSQYQQLAREWKRLGNDQNERATWIKEHKRLFDELGVSISNVAEADRAFSEEGTQAYIQAVRRRAIADAYAQKYAAAALKHQQAWDLIGDLRRANGGKTPTSREYKQAVKDFNDAAKEMLDAQRKIEEFEKGAMEKAPGGGYSPVTTGGTDDGGKPAKDKVKDLLTLQRQLEDAQTANIEDEYARLEQAEIQRHKRFIEDREAELNLLSEDDPRRAVIQQQIEEERETHDRKMLEIDEKYRQEIIKQSEDEEKAREKAAKDGAKAELKAAVDGWAQYKAKMVEDGKTRKQIVEAEVAAEIARLNLMLQLNRDVNGEIMSDEQKAKVQEWINLLEKLQKTGNYGDYKPGQFMGKGGANVTNERKNYANIWEVLGIDMDNNQVSALNSVFDQAKEALNSWMDARKAAADQAKELADDEVSAAENALNREIELRNQGYANDVALREKELADAKEKQKKAVELQAKYKKEQVLLDAAMQTSSMITASANIFKQFPIYVAIPMLATLWGAFGYAKIQAYQAAEKSVQFKEGGVMLLEGGSHESGHDVNLGIGPDGSNLRAEGGEYFAVINKRSSRKYGSQIPAVVNALNSGMFEDRYIKTSDAVGLLPQVIRADNGTAVDLSSLEGGVDALVKQGEQNWTIEGGYRVLRYKNLTRRVKIG